MFPEPWYVSIIKAVGNITKDLVNCVLAKDIKSLLKWMILLFNLCRSWLLLNLSESISAGC